MRIDRRPFWFMIASAAVLLSLPGGGLGTIALAASAPAQSAPPVQPAAAEQAPASRHTASPRVQRGDASVVRSVVLPAGTMVRVRLNQKVSTASNRPGDRFTATLAEPLVLNGRTLAPRGALLEGIVRDAAPSGRLKGQARLAIALDRIDVKGRRRPIATNTVSHLNGGHKKRNLGWIGGGSAFGALVGGLATGGVGAVVGAASGAAAGTAGALVTGRKQVTLPAESLVSFRLEQPLSLRL